jgi:hypothetical protein
MPVPDGFYEATFLMKNSASTRIATCSLGLLSLDVTPPDADAAADDIYAIAVAAGNPFAPGQMIDDWSFEGVSVAQGTSTGDIIGQHLQHADGTVSDSVPPSNCAVLIKKNTASGGRRYRGRLFLPPIFLNEGAVDPAGNIAGSPLTSMQNQWNSFYDDLIAGDWVPTLFHQGAGAPSPTAITSFTVQSLIGTQRRRMRS